MMKILLALAFFALSTGVFPVTYYDKLLARGYGKYWQKLIHFEENNFLPSYSRLDNREFFLNSEGNKDPEKEFNGTVDAFQSGIPLIGEQGLHPQCAFPERLKLIKALNIAPLPEIKCPEFEAWKNKYRPSSISLIYMSNSPRNIKSYLGEVFFKLVTVKGRANACYFKMYEHSKRKYIPDLAKKIIGMNTSGIELSDFETLVNQDKDKAHSGYYEYKLKLTDDEIDKILDHIWELKNQKTFNYYLFGENSSFFIADLLQLAKDDWNLIKNNKPYFTPKDLIHNLMNYQDIIEDISFHSTSADRPVSLPSSPDKAHKNQRIDFSSSLYENHPVVGMGYQAGYHGQLSSDEGYQAFSNLDFLRVTLAYDTDVKKYSVPEVGIIDYTFLYPITKNDFEISQKGAIKKDHADDIDFAFKSRSRVYYGIGLTYNTIGMFSLFSGLEYQQSSYTKKHSRLGPWFEWTMFFNTLRNGKLILRQKLFSSFLEELGDAYYLENELSSSVSLSKNYELYFKNSVVTKTGSFKLGQYKIMLGLGKYF